MRQPFRMNGLMILCILCVGMLSSLRADPASCIFSNSLSDLTVRFDPGTYEVGDQIILAGTERYLTYFDFEFWGTNTANPISFAGSVQARVQFYLNDGGLYNGYATPGTSFYDSGWFAISPTERSTLIFTAGSDFPSGGLYIPADEMTWSVTFTGLGLTDTAGVDLYSPPGIGQDYPDYWQNDGSGWILLTNGVAMNFGARMYAVIPEPSVFTLAALGGLGMLIAARYGRRKD
jgi:hypothetical protein